MFVGASYILSPWSIICVNWRLKNLRKLRSWTRMNYNRIDGCILEGSMVKLTPPLLPDNKNSHNWEQARCYCKLAAKTRDQVWSKITTQVFRSHSQSIKTSLYSNPPKEVKILLILFGYLFKSKPFVSTTTLNVFQERKTTKTKQGSPKDKQERHKNKES